MPTAVIEPGWFVSGSRSDFPSVVRYAGFPSWAASCGGAEFKLAIFRKSTPADLKRAKLVGAARAAAPRVIAAEYDEARDRLALEFDRGFAIAVSLRGVPGFQNATAQDLREIEILGSGDAVYFCRIDQSLNVPNLLAELTEPLSSSANWRPSDHNQPPMRVQGGYLVRTSGEPPPPPPKGGSSLRPPKT